MSIDKDRPCEVCGYTEFIAGVAASPLGPCSFNYCGICIRMGAEPKGWIAATVDCCGGIEHVRSELLLTYYDNETDSYRDFRTGEVVPIMTKEPVHTFEKRSDVVSYLRKKEQDSE